MDPNELNDYIGLEVRSNKVGNGAWGTLYGVAVDNTDIAVVSSRVKTGRVSKYRDANGELGVCTNAHLEYIARLIPVEKPKKIPVHLYTNTCGFCKSPAIKYKRNAINICSNSKCKSWKALRKSAAAVNTLKDVDVEGYIICPTCKERGVHSERLEDKAGTSMVYCKHDHNWLHKWKEGHKRVGGKKDEDGNRIDRIWKKSKSGEFILGKFVVR